MHPRLRLGVFAVVALLGLSLLASRLPETFSTFPGLPALARRLPFTASAQTNPVVTVSAASYETVVAPDSLASVFGVQLATATATGSDTDPNTPGVQLPTTLSGTYVEINGQRAGLIFVSPSQINLLIPAGLSAGVANVRVVAGNGAVSTGTVQINTLGPGIFTGNADGRGVPAAVLLRVQPNGAQNFESLLFLDTTSGKLVSKPIELGPEGEQVYLILYATGFRRANDTNGDGNLNETVRIVFAGSEVTPLFAGRLPDLAGLEQVNVLIPRSLIGRGKVALSVNVPGAVASNVVEIDIAGPSGTTPPQVTGFGNASALAGQVVTIQGNGFSVTPSENLVRIGDLEATVTAASASQLSVIAPYSVETAPVTVRTTTGETRSNTALPVRTSVSGIVETTNRLPLSDVTVRVTSLINGQTVTTKTGANGVFVAADVPTGAAFIKVIGSSVATSPTLETLTLSITAAANRDNQYPQTIYLQPSSGVSAQVGGSGSGQAAHRPETRTDNEDWLAQQALTRLQIGGVTFELPSNAAALFPDGATRGLITLTQIEASRLPVRFPDGVFSSVVVQLTPFGTLFNPGGKLTFPNADGYPAGSQVKLFKLDQGERSPTLGRFLEVGFATVSSDGQRIETEANAITEAAYYFVGVQRQTTTLIGRALDADGSPVRRALIRARGHEQFTDGNGGFILRNVPVLPGQDLLTLEASLLRPGGRSERLTRANIVTIANGTTEIAPALMFGSATSNQPPVIIAPSTFTAEAGKTVEIPLLASDPDSEQPVNLNVTGASFAAVTRSTIARAFLLRLTPTTADVGDRDLTLIATDSQGLAATRTLRLTVKLQNRAPVANDQRVTTDEDVARQITLTATDADADALTFSIVTLPGKGTLSGTAPNLTYTPNKDLNGTDTFTFKTSDGRLESNTATVTLTINPVNDAPVLVVPEAQTVKEGDNLTFTISGTDVDEGQTLKFSAPNLPTGASFVEAQRRFTWTPNFNQAGTYNVMFTLVDNGTPARSDIKTVTITVTDTNRAPLATSANVATDEDKAVTVTLTGSDPDGDQITFATVTPPSKGTLSGTAPNLTYTPSKDFNGTDSFTFKTNDGKLDSAPGTISITVRPVNDAPTATTQTVTTDEDVAKAITLTGADVDGDALSFAIVTPPTKGTLSAVSAAGVVTYTPNANANGADSFTFKASDGKLDSAPATVTLNVTPVNDAPRATAQTVVLDEDTSKPFTLAGTDLENDPLTFALVTQPRNGALSGTAPNLTYTPNRDFSGTDSFTFKVNDGKLDSAAATVTLTVNGLNDPPSLNVPGPQTVAEGQNISFTVSATDPDGNDTVKITAPQLPSGASFIEAERRFTWTPNFDQAGTYTVGFGAADNGTPARNDFKTVTITVTSTNRAPRAEARTVTTNEDTAVAIVLTGSDPDGDAVTLAVVTAPQRGTLSGTAPNLTYTPNKDINGSDSFTFKANDGSLDSQLAVVTINIALVNDAPVINVPPAQTVNEGKALSFQLAASDVDANQTFTFSSNNLPPGATLTPAGLFTWTPGNKAAGTYTVNFTVTDSGSPALNNSGSVAITVTNPGPVATPQTITLDEDVPKQFALPVVDPDGDTLSYAIVSGPQRGALSGTAPNLTYTPTLNYHGTDSFTFKASDGTLESETVTISLVINPVNDAPVINVPPAQTVNENQALSFAVTASDVDTGQTVTLSATDVPTGAAFNAANGTFTWTPTFSQQGTYTVNFTATDNGSPAQSSVKPVQITVANVNRAPSGRNQQISTFEELPVSFTLQATDPDNDALTFVIVTPPTGGKITGTVPNLTYTPNKDFSGFDKLDYKVNDGGLESGVFELSFTVVNVNDAPVLTVPGAQTVNEGQALNFTVTALDVDPGDKLTFSATGLPTGATLNPTTGAFAWTPTFAQAGSYTISFSATDSGAPALRDTKNVTIRVNDVETPPVAAAQQLATDEETPLAIVLTATDLQSDPLTFTVLTQPANGALSGTAPNLTYTPKLNFVGTDSFTFKANDGKGDSNIATITLTVRNVNDLPVAAAQSVQAVEDTPKAIVLSASDVDGDALTYAIVTPPTKGVLSGTAPNLTYTPNRDATGADSFTFKANDGKGDSNTATVSLTIGGVNDPPVATAQTITTDEDVAKAIVLAATDPDGDTLTYQIVTPPTKGTLSGTAPNLTYTPNPNVNGTDSFTFKANDGKLDSNVATVSLTINAVNDPPVLTVPGAQTVDEGSALEFSVSATDVDPNQTLTFSASNLPSGANFNAQTRQFTWTPTFSQQGSYTVSFTATDNGAPAQSDTKTVAITVRDFRRPPIASSQTVTTDEDVAKAVTLGATDPDGLTLTYQIITPPTKGVLSGTAPNLTYTPNANANGADSFTFKANNGFLDSNTATVSLTINQINDLPVLNAPDARNANEGEAISFLLTATDADTTQTLTFSATNLPEGATLNPQSGAFAWTPAFNQAGTYSVTFTVTDNGSPVLSASKTTSFTITDVNRRPLAESFPVTVGEDTPKTITLLGSDADGDPITYAIVEPPAHGTLSGTAPNVTYTPAQNYNGPDSFTYKTNDGKLDSINGLVTINVSGVNEAPVLTVPGTQNVNVGQTVAFTVSATDADPGQIVTLSASNLPNGATFNAQTGAFSWTPGSTASITVSFTATDNGTPPQTDTKTVQINVGQTNGAPTCSPQSVSTAEDTAKQIALSCTDPNSNPLTYSIVTPPASGTVTLNGATATYTPNANFSGTDSFTFKANDGSLDSSAATVSITVTPVCDPPVLTVPGAQSVVPGQTLNFSVTASDPDSSALTLTATNLPTGATFTPSTNSGQFSWTPAGTFPTGSYTVTFTVTDDCSPTPQTVSQTVTITVTQTVQDWTPAPGPEGGKITALATISSTLFAATQGGGVFRSLNNGNTWTAVNSGLTNLNVLSLVAHNGTLYAGTAGSGIFRSTDSGATWSAFNTGLSQNFNFIFVYHLTVSDAGLYAVLASEDLGIQTVYRTGLTGASWAAFSNNLDATSFTDIQVAGTKVFVSTFFQGVFASDITTANWISFNNGFGEGVPLVSSLTASGNLVYVGTSNGVYTSPVTADQWTAFNTNFSSGTDVFTVEVVGTTLYARARLLEASNFTLFRSPLDRANWLQIDSGIFNRAVNAFAGVGSAIFAGTEGSGVFRSTDQGGNWVQVNGGLNASFVLALAVKGNLLFAGLDGGGIYVSSDNGKNWTPANGGLATLFPLSVNAFATDGTTLYAATSTSGVYRSTNDGQTWSSFNDADLADTLVRDLVISNGRLFAAAADRGLFSTALSSPEWSAISVNGMFIVNSATLFKTDTNLFLGTGDTGSVFRSDLNGQEWALVGSGLSANVPVTSFAARGANLFAGRNGDGVFRSTDNGGTFTNVVTGLTNKNVSGLRGDAARLYATTFEHGVFVSTNDGTNWTQIITNLTNLRTRAIVLKDNQIFVGTEGSGVFVRPIKE